jgi:acyl carrier protein
MGMDLEVAEAVQDVVRTRARLAADARLPADLRLGPGGLGLDSISLAELLLDCERRFGLTSSADLLAGPPLTVGLLISHVQAATER